MIYLSRVLVAANETQASQRAVDNSVGSNPPPSGSWHGYPVCGAASRNIGNRAGKTHVGIIGTPESGADGQAAAFSMWI